MIRIKYTNTAGNVAGINYDGTGFIPELFLDVNVGKPIYNYIEEGNENRDMDFNRSFARIEKQYSFETAVQEYILDALMVMQLHDHIEITLSNGTTVYPTELRVSDPEWTAAEAFARVTVTFVVYAESTSPNCN